ncbi:MAG: DUF4824 family protein [Betaproteobacteria bacterium]|nr:DUF4824 family protein [Betaproteobacteria bacterium]
MKWSRKHTLLAGVTLIAAMNIVVLAGVAYNRGGEPHSTLRLTERELHLPYVWRGEKENSGLSLQLQWRVWPSTKERKLAEWAFQSNRSAPVWLDEAKMSALGFDTSHQGGVDDAWSFYRRQLPRDVFLALEMDGAAYQTALARAREMEKINKDGPRILKEEQEENSRLFVVDADLDRAALRVKYPDRNRYAIIRGQVRPAWQGDNSSIKMSGYVNDLNVPLDMRDIFGDATESRAAGPARNAKFDAEVAYGQKLEPWIVNLAKRRQ